MRGALLVAAVIAALVGVSHAATVDFSRSTATIAVIGDKSFGAIAARRDASDASNLALTKGRVTVGEGLASVGPGTASVQARDVELLGGRIRAQSVRRDEDGGEVVGLRIDGRRFGVIRQSRTISLGIGVRLVLNEGDSGLRLETPGVDVQLAVVGVETVTREVPDPTPTPKPKKTPKPKPTATATPKPPKTPPRLTAGGYAFPVVGDANFTDTFGAPRQAAIGTHEGVDIFGEFGAPAVAVRDGRLIKVGTLPISGNRLWVIADNGDAFFYAHLSSFASAARNGARVEAGDVIGFVGNTGDAEPTPPHVHFEVHPGGLNKDAVNPTPILRAWQRSEDVPPGAWVQRLGADAAARPGALVTVRDFIAE